MSDYIKIDWADVRVDDVLMHENGDRMTVTMTGFTEEPSLLLVGGAWRDAGNLAGLGYTPHRRGEPVPTEPGAYHDRDGKTWLLDSSGDWFEGVIWREAASMTYRGPFTRLVPMPTHEQVEQVLVNEGCTMHFSGALAVMSLLEGESDD